MNLHANNNKHYSCSEGGMAHAAVITQSPEVKTTNSAQPWSHDKQTNTRLHSHDTQSICLWDPATPQIKNDFLVKTKDS